MKCPCKVIKSVTNPVNCFKNQIVIENGDIPKVSKKILFKSQLRHLIVFRSIGNLLKNLKACINPNVTNALLCDLSVPGKIQVELQKRYPATRFVHTPQQVIDVFNEDDQTEIIAAENNRAHRSAKKMKSKY